MRCSAHKLIYIFLFGMNIDQLSHVKKITIINIEDTKLNMKLFKYSSFE